MNPDLSAFKTALTQDDEAHRTFTWLSPEYQADFLVWIESAASKTESKNRLRAAIDMLAGRDVIRRN
jgi:hypothetical protein